MYSKTRNPFTAALPRGDWSCRPLRTNHGHRSCTRARLRAAGRTSVAA